jgi:beta-lactamase regulating signal transducer with metallopeptidase domain
VIAHLVESTLILGIAIAAAHLPRLAARTRYAIVFLALVKFAIPWKLHPPSGTIAISIPGPIAVTPHAFAAPSIWPTVAMSIWISIAAALFLLIVWRARRAVAEALEGATPAPEREQALLPRGGVLLLRSPGASAPVAVGIVRPRIVIPANLVLDDDELESILAHECAHIARHDNVLALVDAAAGAALWFHPLVWIARRILARAREEACDEVVVARGGPEVYLAALAKVCRAAAAPRVAGVSCIVSNTIRERMNAIMTLSLRRPLSHRLVVAAAVALLAAVTLVQAAQEKTSRYTMLVSIEIVRDGQYLFDITVRDNVTNEVVAHPRVQTGAGVPAEITIDGSPKYVIRALGEKDGHAEVVMKVFDENGNAIDGLKTVSTVNKQAAQPITLSLKDADLKDVIRVFGQLTGLETKVEPDVDGRVSVQFDDVPWDKALQRILFDNHCEYEIEGKTLHVRRIR